MKLLNSKYTGRLMPAVVSLAVSPVGLHKPPPGPGGTDGVRVRAGFE
jgi:hypothetical protein